MERAPHVYIIAEAGVNHDGSEERARGLVDIAAAAGADAVKFQLFSPEALVTETAPTAEYQARNLNDTQISQRDMLQKLTLPVGALPRLEAYCRHKGIDFLCTPFDHASLDYLTANTKMRYLKLPSGEVANGPLLLAAARKGLPIILSTGMSSLEEIGIALSVLHFGYMQPTGYPKALQHPDAQTLRDLRGKVTLLHCVSQYPAPVASMNLRAMDTMAKTYGLPVGLSDHSLGLTQSIAACALGAVMVEKHFTYDVRASGPDHAASLSPEGLKALVQAIRDVQAGLGTGEKICRKEEENTRAIARRSVVAAVNIPKETVFSEENLTAKRPATGPVAPNRLWELLGKRSKRDYGADDFIDRSELDI